MIYRLRNENSFFLCHSIKNSELTEVLLKHLCDKQSGVALVLECLCEHLQWQHNLCRIMWGAAWGPRLSPRSLNCLNSNLRSFLCCLTNYPCSSAESQPGSLAKLFQDILLQAYPGKYVLPSTAIFSSTSQSYRELRDCFFTRHLQ